MIEVRPASADDAPAIARLMAQLGYPHSPAGIAAQLATLSETPYDLALVAGRSGEVGGVLTLHMARMLFYPAPVARITTLVVDRAARRHGLGRALVEEALALARDFGCGTIELTTALRREDAQAFYRALGFEGMSLRMGRALG